MESRAPAPGNFGVSRHLKESWPGFEHLQTPIGHFRNFVWLGSRGAGVGQPHRPTDHTRKKAATAASLGWAGRARKLPASGPAPRPSSFSPASSPSRSLLPLLLSSFFFSPSPPTHCCTSSPFPLCFLVPGTFVPFFFFNVALPARPFASLLTVHS